MRKLFQVILFLSLSALMLPFLALSEDGQNPPSESDSLLTAEEYERDPFDLFDDDAEAWIDRNFATADNLLQTQVNQVDEFFADQNSFQEYRGNRIRVRLENEYHAEEGYDFSAKFRFSISLPGSQNRASIVAGDLSSMDEDLSDVEDGNNGVGLRFFLLPDDTSRKHYDSSITLGLGSGPALVTRWRNRVSLYSGNWENRLIAIPFYDTDDGFGIDGRWEADRPFSEDWMFRNRLGGTYSEETQDEGDDFDFYNSAKVYYFPNVRYGFSAEYRLDGATGDENSDLRLTSGIQQHILRLEYRQAFYKDLLFFEIQPGLDWDEKYDWDTNAFIFLNFEILIGGPGGRRGENLRNDKQRQLDRIEDAQD